MKQLAVVLAVLVVLGSVANVAMAAETSVRAEGGKLYIHVDADVVNDFPSPAEYRYSATERAYLDSVRKVDDAALYAAVDQLIRAGIHHVPPGERWLDGYSPSIWQMYQVWTARKRVSFDLCIPLVAGPTGPSGLAGPPGNNGQNGHDGTNGKDGCAGAPGITPDISQAVRQAIAKAGLAQQASVEQLASQVAELRQRINQAPTATQGQTSGVSQGVTNSGTIGGDVTLTATPNLQAIQKQVTEAAQAAALAQCRELQAQIDQHAKQLADHERRVKALEELPAHVCQPPVQPASAAAPVLNQQQGTNIFMIGADGIARIGGTPCDSNGLPNLLPQWGGVSTPQQQQGGGNGGLQQQQSTNLFFLLQPPAPAPRRSCLTEMEPEPEFPRQRPRCREQRKLEDIYLPQRLGGTPTPRAQQVLTQDQGSPGLFGLAFGKVMDFFTGQASAGRTNINAIGTGGSGGNALNYNRNSNSNRNSVRGGDTTIGINNSATGGSSSSSSSAAASAAAAAAAAAGQ